jgi:Inner membrane protein YgaP-like, transmembrane domain
MTLEPILRGIAGLFVAASVVLGLYVHPYFLFFTLFVGLNLLQSSFTNWCPMITFLRKLGVPDAHQPLSAHVRGLQKTR